MQQSNITFFGTSPRSAKFLELALKNGLIVDLVVSEPPKPVGKKQIPTENPTVILSKRLGLPSVTLFRELSLTMKQSNNETIGLILDFNKIIPGNIINLFPKGIINIHFSKLPAYRGPAPVQYTILNGEKEAWITYYFINENLDEGYILAQTSFSLDLTENTETLYQKLIAKAATEISSVIDDYLSDKVQLHKQEGVSSSTKKLNTKNSQIDWKKPAEEIGRLIRAAYPEPGAWTTVECKVKSFDFAQDESEKLKVMRLKILRAHLEKGKLVLDLVQLEGKNPVTWKQFQEGYPSFSFP